ncbi:MAG: hypothetical protein CVU71_01710 [Deltaproteobacteria bacterium HGW-Deltaproteobacteria-6]|jgi:hypothetical protein|nr:MAG: hypothetical protein CVU71_01710 [Deltaproteobacteria bacterium HGW-Deltaproteobacteria-6]
MKRGTNIGVVMTFIMVIGFATQAGAVGLTFANTSELPNNAVKYRAYMSVLCEGQEWNFAPNDTKTINSCGVHRIGVYISPVGTWTDKCCAVKVPSHSDANFRVTFDGNLKVHYEGSGDNPPRNDYSCTPKVGSCVW